MSGLSFCKQHPPFWRGSSSTGSQGPASAKLNKKEDQLPRCQFAMIARFESVPFHGVPFEMHLALQALMRSATWRQANILRQLIGPYRTRSEALMEAQARVLAALARLRTHSQHWTSICLDHSGTRWMELCLLGSHLGKVPLIQASYPRSFRRDHADDASFSSLSAMSS